MERKDRSTKPPVCAHIRPHGRFCATFAPDRYEAAEKMADVHELVIRPFGVVLRRVDGTSKIAHAGDWERVEGWSTWLPQEQDDA